MKMMKIFDHIFILRPMLHLPVWTIMILGFYRSQPADSSWHILPVSLLLGTGIFGAVFLINQIYDIESDRLNNKLFFLPEGIVKLSIAWLMTIILNLASLIVAFYISFSVGLASLLIIILGVLYSVPPIALKNKTWLAAFANGLGHGTLVFIIGYCAGGGSFFGGIVKSIPYFMAVAAVYIGTTLPDIKGDRKTGKLTIGVVFGEQKTVYIILLYYITAIVFSYLINDIPFLLASLFVAPFYIWLLISKTVKTAVMAIKMSILSLTFAAGYFYPGYIIFLIGLILATRLYYKRRFKMTYPSIK